MAVPCDALTTLLPLGQSLLVVQCLLKTPLPRASPELTCVHSSYLTYIKLSTAIKRNKNMAQGLQRALLQQQPDDDSKRSPRPQDLIRLYDIILQVTLMTGAARAWPLHVLDTQ